MADVEYEPEYVEVKYLRFDIYLFDSYPAVWRTIEVPADYSFWDLHVAIQDAFGWQDCHLHEFQPLKKGPTGGKHIGLPDDSGFDEFDVVAGWEVPIKKYFTALGNRINYLYDFGDHWQHEVRLTGMLLKQVLKPVPECIDGGGLCPPEDCGGIHGYRDLCFIVEDKEHEQHEEVCQWLQGMGKAYWPFDPEKFNKRKVKFDDPDKRWRQSFGDIL